MSERLPLGCYVRDYSLQHLQAHPDQVVDRISLDFSQLDDLTRDITAVDVEVLLADQGHAAREGYGGQRVLQSAANFMSPLEFHTDCDGGSFAVIRFSLESVLIETTGFRLIGDDMTCVDEFVETDLSEQVPGSPTRYLLYRAEDAACDW
ncbi:hypothetical protein [Yoonia maricola]|nr:hypothetical protein [Yoonia maricola]